MNTSKQVNIMIGLLFFSFVVFGAYIVTEGRRAEAARFEQDATAAQRGATIFVNNCRSCHGIHGLGPDEGGIAPKLNGAAYLVLEEDNALGLPATPDADRRSIEDFLHNTIACGRTNTAMPTWSEEYGGPLSDIQIGYLVKMITQGRWDVVEHVTEAHDAEVREQEAAAYAMFGKRYTATGAEGLTKEQKVEVDRAIISGTATSYAALSPADKTVVDENIKKGILADPAALAVTSKNCGQYTGAAARDFRERNALVSQPAPAATASPVATSGGGTGGGGTTAGARVNATMTEFAIQAPGSASTGSTQFVVKNGGAILHEFVVVKTDTAPDKLEQRSGIVDESKVQVLGRIEQYAAGEEKTVTVNLTPGKYVLLCNVVGHYQLGMHAPFEAK